jgi:peptide deformylase
MTEAAQIAQLGAKILRQQADVVTEIDSIETQKIIDTLRMALASTQGVGIAAPQIGVSKRIIIVASRPTARYPTAPLMTPTVMINPTFWPLSLDDKEQDWEGCLSIPGIRALVPRYVDIRVHYTDPKGAFIEAQFSGFVARVFQHEFDHLEGKVYLDRVIDNRDIVSESEFLKRVEA